jgi:hypothetical protein
VYTTEIKGQHGNRMKLRTLPPSNLGQWVEFCWLLAIDPTFQAAHDKRKAYFEYRLGKIYNLPCC